MDIFEELLFKCCSSRMLEADHDKVLLLLDNDKNEFQHEPIFSTMKSTAAETVWALASGAH